MRIKRGSRIFVDTNVLLEASDAGRPCHSLTSCVWEDWPAAGLHLVLSGQVVREYLVVSSPRWNKMG
jgi:predicted nucleic acid-binding protein